MNNNVKKMLGAGAIGVFALITLLNTQAIGKLSNSNNVTYSYQAESANVAAVEENSLFSQVDREDVLAQVGGSGSCNGAVTASALPVPNYNLQDYTSGVTAFKFRIKNTNTLSSCTIGVSDIYLMNLNKTTASTNFAKVGLFQGTTPINVANTPISTSYNDTSIRFLPQNDINIAPGQFVDLSVRVDYLRNTNVPEDQGAPFPADYFMFGIDTIKIDTNGTADGGYTNASVSSRFDKPIKVQ